MHRSPGFWGKPLETPLATDQRQHLPQTLQWQNGKFWSFQPPGIPNLTLPGSAFFTLSLAKSRVPPAPPSLLSLLIWPARGRARTQSCSRELELCTASPSLPGQLRAQLPPPLAIAVWKQPSRRWVTFLALCLVPFAKGPASFICFS